MKTIIHIDDDLDDLAIFKEVITRINPSYLLHSFSDSQTAVNYLHEIILTPSIIFLDINMPLLSGKETLLLIRRNKTLKDVPVVMYSTNIYGADKKTYEELGANEFLKKANDFDGMAKDVDRLLLKFIKYNMDEFYNEQKNRIR